MVQRRAVNTPSSAVPAAPRGCTHFKLKQLGRLLGRHYDRFVAPTGLKTGQYSLLSTVMQRGPLRLGELASAMRLDASTLSRNLQPLLDKGLLVVQAGDDARCRTVQATAAGLALRAQAQRSWKRAQAALNLHLGAARVVALHAMLDDCLNILESSNLDPIHADQPD